MVTDEISGYLFKSYSEAILLLLKGKPLLCTETLKRCIYKYVGDKTFLELYEENHWNLNITVTDGRR